MKLPDSLLKTLHDCHDDAAAWLKTFPSYLNALEEQWGISVTGLVEDLSFNVVMLAASEHGTSYILKMSPPGDEFRQEVSALTLYNGDGIARLIKSDLSGGAMLLERLRPGVSFWRSTDDVLATETCADLLQRLWRPINSESGFRDLESWTRDLKAYLEHYPNGGGFIPHVLADKANVLRDDLLSNTTEQVLLHADLHHGNILSASREPYLAIDPKGVVGARGYDLASFLLNPAGLVQRADFKHILERRITIFHERLHLSTQEIAMWGYMHTVLSSCWSGAATSGTADNFAIAGELARYF